jgi:hypothetical protein
VRRWPFSVRFVRVSQNVQKKKSESCGISYNFDIVFPISVILIGQELINFLCVVLNFLNKMYVNVHEIWSN